MAFDDGSLLIAVSYATEAAPAKKKNPVEPFSLPSENGLRGLYIGGSLL